jgi:phage major head subunit gpT-like protein
MSKPVIIRGDTIRNLGVGFQAKFQGALRAATSMYPKIATEVPSSTTSEDYGWLNDIPGVREWIGDRKVNQLSASGYSIKNKDWEITIAVDRNDVEDDNVGIYGPKVQITAENTQRHYDALVFGLLKAGFATTCYDGQYFFDTDHPILDANGNETSFANTDGGAGAGWFLAVTGQALLPIILQKRRDYQFVSKDSPNDEGVFWQKKFFYGADARYNVGYGLPQLCWGSKQDLDDAHFNAARQALLAMTTDYGHKVAPAGFTLFVGPSNVAAAEKLLLAANLANGATNTNYKKADLVIAPWLD